MVLAFLQDSFLPPSVGKSLIIIIPKVQSSELITQSWNISLCNMVLKLITKLLVNKMKLVLPSLIAPTQSSFIPRHQLHNNVIIFSEVIHSIQAKNYDVQWMMLKIHLKKVYDRLRWDFLFEALAQAQFLRKWVYVIEMLLT